jgi:uncharacterized membrane protein
MSNSTTAPDATRPEPVSPRELAWLTGQVARWRADGTIDERQVGAILGRYQASRRFGLTTLVLALGAAFVGVGLIWLVAANLDQLSPTWRFVVVAGLWVGLTVGAEMLASGRHRLGALAAPLVHAGRILAALAFGAVVFQAAQSLQVPAYEPRLVGYWALGALVYAYGVRGVGPAVVGLVAGSVWFIWQVLWEEPSGLGAVLAFVVAGVVVVSAAVLQQRWWPAMAELWRELGALLLLVGLFASAVPGIGDGDFAWTAVLIAGLVVAGAGAAAAVAFTTGRTRLEPIGAAGVAAVSVLLVLWDTGADPDQVGAADWAHALVAVAAYVVAAAGVAALGVLRDSWRLTALATVALVVFTTFQSFAVFAQIVQGAWIFVLLGVVFLVTGILVDRGRRRLAVTLEGEES